MKLTVSKVMAALFLGALAAGPLRAETNVSASMAPVNGMEKLSVTRPELPADPRNAIEVPSLTPILVGLFGTPVLILAISLYGIHRRNKMMHETLRSMVEKGVPIPEEMFKNTGNNCAPYRNPFEVFNQFKSPRNDLRKGLIWTAIGLGIVICFGKAGFIVIFIGLAYLLLAVFDMKSKSDNQSPKP